MTKFLTLVGLVIVSWILIGLLFQLIRTFTHVAIIVLFISGVVMLVRALFANKAVDISKRAR